MEKRVQYLLIEWNVGYGAGSGGNEVNPVQVPRTRGD